MNSTIAAAGDPSFEELKYIPYTQGIFIFLYMYILASWIPYAQSNFQKNNDMYSLDS